MEANSPQFLVMAGPNGAGKSTCVVHYLPAGVPYINADDIARTLAPTQTQEADVQAARIALERMDAAEARRESFATETTLASKTLASRAARLQRLGYVFHLVYIWSPSPDYSISRVAGRVRLGGHNIPEDTIRRRWLAGLKNFFSLYQPIADQWEVVDNIKLGHPRRIAAGQRGASVEVFDPILWDRIQRRANDAT